MLPTPAVPLIRAVLFDYGLVLSGPPDPAAWEEMKSVLRTSEAKFKDAYWIYRHDYDRGTLNAENYWRKVAQHLGVHLTPDQHARLIDADTTLWTQPNQPMIEWAASLQSAGVPTGILSNIGDAMEHGILQRCAWLSAFHHHTFSHRLLMAKPEPAIYAYAAAGLKAAPEHILFIDDREDNICAAQAVGMQAVQYTSHEDFVRQMHVRGFASLLKPVPKV